MKRPKIFKRKIAAGLAALVAAAGITFSSKTAYNYNPGTMEDQSIHPLLVDKLEEFASPENFDNLEVKIGTINEDCPDDHYRRSFNHFQKWDTGDPFPWSPFLNLPSPLPVKEWAVSSRAQIRYPFGDHTWRKVIEEYQDGTIGRNFGHIFHLISDLTVPAHTRLDGHPGDSELLEEATRGLWNGEFYESWTDVNKDILMSKIYPTRIPQFHTLDELFNSLAYFTGSNFYSDNTVDDTISCNFEGKYCYRDVEGKKTKIWRKGFLRNFPDTQCLGEYWAILGTKAVEYGKAALDLLAQESCVPTAEVCDGLDNDCNGEIDEGAMNTYWRDSDSDGHGNVNDAMVGCTAPAGYVNSSDDCNDHDFEMNPGNVEICDRKDNNCNGRIDEGVLRTYHPDRDGDGFGDGRESVQACGAAQRRVENGADCNDANAAIHPGELEICDGFDNDCDGETDEGLTTTSYRDADDDGYGDPNSTAVACGVPDGFVRDNIDCDDNDANVNPGIMSLGKMIRAYDINGDSCDPSYTFQDDDFNGDKCVNFDDYEWFINEMIFHPNRYELCENKDRNCDGIINDGYDVGLSCNVGLGVCTHSGVIVCDPPYPSCSATPGTPQTEVCDGRDNNCDGQTDEEVLLTSYRDNDSDGYGNANNYRTSCTNLAGYVRDNTDCNDNNANIHLNKNELCNGIDDNCNGQIDESVAFTYYRDADSDGYGNPGITTTACNAPIGYVINNTDCNDNNANVNPGIISYWEYLGIIKDWTGTLTCDPQHPHFELGDYNRDGCIDNRDYTDVITAVQSHPERFEKCGDPDTNCDGKVNENWWVLGMECYSSGLGECSLPGKMRCNSSGTDYLCDGPIGQPVEESCNFLDDNCDGEVDEGVETTFYRDQDGDGYGNINSTIKQCPFLGLPQGYVLLSSDCDDNNNTINPSAREVYDSRDNDCDGQTNEGLCVPGSSIGCGSSVGTCTTGVERCDSYGYYGSCSGTMPVAESCDGWDNDCDGSVDNGAGTNFYRDADGDGIGTNHDIITACSKPFRYVNVMGDCNDNNANIYPGKNELCNGVDDNCNGQIDEGFNLGSCTAGTGACARTGTFVCSGNQLETICNAVPGTPSTEVCDGVDNDCDGVRDNGLTNTYYVDADGDGYGDPNNTRVTCAQPMGYVANNLDCNDNNGSVHSNATESCNLIDDNCNGQIDEGCVGTCLDDYLEQNDDFSTATLMTEGETLSNLKLCSTESDFFKIYFINGSQLNINFTLNPPHGGARYIFYRSDEGIIDNGNVFGTSENSHSMAIPGLVNGYYYLQLYRNTYLPDWDITYGINFTIDHTVCIDNDGDGYGSGCSAGSDCNDNKGSVHLLRTCNYNGSTCGSYNLCTNSCPTPPAEVLDGQDNDCNGQIDEGFVGTGNPQITLMWGNSADLDLHVVSPSGCEIYYGNRNCGAGHLDRDAHRVCDTTMPPENIYWDLGQAPTGTYTVKVNYFKDCGQGATNYTVNVARNGTVTTYTGTLSAQGQTNTVTTFSN